MSLDLYIELFRAIDERNLERTKMLSYYLPGNNHTLMSASRQGPIIPIVMYIMSQRECDDIISSALCIGYALSTSAREGRLGIVKLFTEIVFSAWKNSLDTHNASWIRSLILDNALISSTSEPLDSRCNINVCMYLVSRGANIYARKSKALKMAAKRKHWIQAEYLLDTTTKLPEKRAKSLMYIINTIEVRNSAIANCLKGSCLSKLVAKYY